MTNDKPRMMPTHGKMPEGLNEKEVVFVQEADGEILTYPVFYVEWDRVVAYCPIETPAPYVPEPDYSKWIGKPCWFWDVEENGKTIGILTDHCKTSTEPFSNGVRGWWRHCRPVTADEIVKE